MPSALTGITQGVADASVSLSALAWVPRGHIAGLTLSNNSGDATNDIDIAVGEATDSSATTVIRLTSAITKRLDAAGAAGTNAGGLDTGSIANTTYHVWLIRNPTTLSVDALFSTSASSPTMPTGFTQARRIGSIVRVSGAIKAFTQDGDFFEWTTPATDVNAGQIANSRTTRTLTVPTGIVVHALVSSFDTGDGSANPGATWVGPLTTTNAAVTLANSRMGFTRVANQPNWSTQYVRTNTSGQIGDRSSTTGTSGNYYLVTHGWLDSRGKNS